MPRISFDSLPDSARLWVFAASRPLATGEQQALLGATDAFLDEWNAHKVPLDAARDLRHDRFLLVGVDEDAAGVSGCSIDSLVRTMKALGLQLGVELIDHASVFYRDRSGVHRLSRDEFSDAVARGDLTPDTIVFDNTVATAGGLRTGRWEAPAASTWHARAFF